MSVANSLSTMIFAALGSFLLLIFYPSKYVLYISILQVEWYVNGAIRVGKNEVNWPCAGVKWPPHLCSAISDESEWNNSYLYQLSLIELTRGKIAKNCPS